MSSLVNFNDFREVKLTKLRNFVIRNVINAALKTCLAKLVKNRCLNEPNFHFFF